MGFFFNFILFIKRSVSKMLGWFLFLTEILKTNIVSSHIDWRIFRKEEQKIQLGKDKKQLLVSLLLLWRVCRTLNLILVVVSFSHSFTDPSILVCLVEFAIQDEVCMEFCENESFVLNF